MKVDGYLPYTKCAREECRDDVAERWTFRWTVDAVCRRRVVL